MKKTKKATSIIEAMIVMLIIVVWITGLYDIFSSSQKLSNTTKNRIEAIEIAREGIEAMKNIRDTNWLMYGWDKQNCWNTFNYDSNCVWGWTFNKITEKSYKIYQNTDYKWKLFNPTISWTSEFKNSDYRNKFRIYKNNWFYTQTWTTNPTKFTREIKIENLTSTWMIVKSIVKWVDNSKKWAHKVELENLLTNWK